MSRSYLAEVGEISDLSLISEVTYSFPLFIQHFLSTLGATIILVGALYAVYQLIFQASRAYRTERKIDLDRIRLSLGKMIILGLEFIVASDVIETTTTPDYYSLGILAILVVIRTFLSFALDRDLNNLGKN